MGLSEPKAARADVAPRPPFLLPHKAKRPYAASREVGTCPNCESRQQTFLCCLLSAKKCPQVIQNAAMEANPNNHHPLKVESTRCGTELFRCSLMEVRCKNTCFSAMRGPQGHMDLLFLSGCKQNAFGRKLARSNKAPF